MVDNSLETWNPKSIETIHAELAALNAESFEAIIGDAFSLHIHGDWHAIRIADIARKKRESYPSSMRSPFSIFFEFVDPIDFVLGQGNFVLRHATLGDLPLFLTPVISASGQCLLEANFS